MSIPESSRSCRTALLVVGLLCALVGTAFALFASAAAGAPADATRYVHDANGRLVGVTTNAAGTMQTAVQKWDPVGNLLSITRGSAETTRVLVVAPLRAAPGETVRIAGTGLGTTPEANTVRIGGVAATVTAASTTELKVSVPSGAVSGAVTVTAPGGAATADDAFTVTAPSTMRIDDVTPRVTLPGTEVAVVGAGFATRRTESRVKVNGVQAEVVSTSTTAVRFLVPPGAGSGRVSVGGPEGTVTGPDLFVSPTGSTTDVADTGRIDIGTPKTVAPGTAGVYLFEGTAGQDVSITTRESSIDYATVRLFRPDGTEIHLGHSGTFQRSDAFFEPIKLQVSGTFAVLVDPSGSTGSVKLQLHDVTPVVTAVAPSPSGTTTRVSLPTPGQKAHLKVTATAGQKVYVRAANSTFQWVSLGWKTPANAWLGTTTGMSPGAGALEGTPFPADGEYTLEVDPNQQATGSVDLTLYAATDVKRSMQFTPQGDRADVTTTVPGQDARLTFEGRAGQRVMLQQIESTMEGSIALYRPDGGDMYIGGYYGMRLYKGAGGTSGPYTLPIDGTYTLHVSPYDLQTGTFSYKIWEVPPPIVSTVATPTPAEPTTTDVEISVPGQEAHAKVQLRAGMRVAVKGTGSTFPYASVSWRNPSGTQIGTSGSLNNDATPDFLDGVPIPADGEYTLVVHPGSQNSGRATLTFYDATDVTRVMDFTSLGFREDVTTTVPGQNVKLTFTARAGQQVMFQQLASTMTGSIQLFRPDGSDMSIGGYYGMSLYKGDNTNGPYTLSQDGTYTFLISPYDIQTGSFGFKLWEVPPPATYTVATPTTQTSNSVDIAVPVPGQIAHVKLQLRAGQRLAVRGTNSTFSYATMNWRNPAGTHFGSSGTLNNDGAPDFFDGTPITADGEYTLVIDPHQQATGTATLTFFDAADVTAAMDFTPDGDREDVTTSVPGQNAKLTFQGRAGQQMMFQQVASAMTGSIQLFRPDGSDMSVGGYYGLSLYKGDNESGPYTLPQDGTYTFLVNPYDTQTGSFGFRVWEVPPPVTKTVDALTPEGTAVDIAIPTAGQLAHIKVQLRAGQRVSVRGTGSTFPYAGLSWRKSDGTALNGSATLNNDAAPDFLDAVQAPSDGLYTLVVDPNRLDTGSATLTLYDVVDLTRSLTPSAAGDATDLNLATPGQNAKVAFSGTAGQQVTVQITGSTVGNGYLQLFKQDGSEVYLGYWGMGFRTGDVTYTLPSLPADGTYTLVVNPHYELTGTMRLTLKLPAPSGGTVGLVQVGAFLASEAYAAVAGDDEPRRAGRPQPRFRSLRDYARSLPVGGPVRPRPPASRPRSDRPRTPQVRTLRAYQRGVTAARPRPAARHAQRVTQRFFRSLRQYGRPLPAPAPKRPAAGVPKAEGLREAIEAQTPPRSALPKPRKLSPRWIPTKRDRGTDWVSNRGASTWAALPPLSAKPGATAVAGQALKLNGEGSKASAVTDATGRFLIADAPRGRRVLLVDGRTARERGERYGIYEIQTQVAGGRTNAIRDTIWMATLDPAGDLRVPERTTKPMVLKNPRVPGFEIRIPAGSTIKGVDGKPVRRLNLTAVPTDRPPYPLPEGVTVPAYFTVQPGGAYLSKGAQVVYPNYTGLPSGQRTDFYNYDPDDRGWYVYGKGTVTKDRKQAVPDPGVRIWEFSAAMEQVGNPKPKNGPPPPKCPCDGDPVDLGTGLFIDEKTDLTLPDIIGADLTRTYRQGDSNDYGFGYGTTSPWDLRLARVEDYKAVDLVMPDGGAVRLNRISPGTAREDAVFAPDGEAGKWTGAKLRWSTPLYLWELETRDGTVYEFPWYLPVSAIRDRHGNALRIRRYRATGAPTQVTTPSGRWLKFTLDDQERIVGVRDNGGRTVSYTYDASNRLATATDANGGVTTYRYDATGQMTSIVDPKNVTWLQNVYDTTGRVTQQTLANGGRYTFAYTVDADDRVTKTTVTDPRGFGREVAFDATGQPVRDTVAKGTLDEQVTAYERDASGRVVAWVDPLLRRTTYEYDARGNVTAVTQLAGTADAVTRGLTYDAYGNVLSTTDELGFETRYRYDDRGRLVAEVDPTNRETTYGYTGGGVRPTSVTDPAGKTTKLTYDGSDLVAAEDPLGRTTKLQVDVLGRTTAMTDPLGDTTRFDFDDGNQIRKITDPRGRDTSYAFDPNGNPTSLTDARGTTHPATYDAMDELATWNDGLARTHRIERDLLGNVTKATDRKGQLTTRKYDGLGRLTFVGYGTGGTATSPTYASTITYTRDKANRLTKVVDSVDGTTTFEYDALDRRTKEISPRGTIAYAHDKAGRRTSMTVTGRPAVAYTYDDAGRPTAITQGANDVRIAYDPAGRRETVTLPNGVTQRRTYDAAAQLTQLRYERAGALLGDLQYEYDAAGRRSAAWGSLAATVLPAPVASATYDAANRMTKRDATTLTYDLNGNLTADGTRIYTWNARNELASVKVGTTTTTFAYDGLGRRVSRTVGKNPITRFLSDGWDVVHELDGSTVTSTLLSGFGLDDAFAQSTATATRTHLTDALGTSVATVDAAGTLTKTPYGTFGESTDTTTARISGFTGAQHDPSGLVFLRARYYSPDLKRFISEDPLGMAGGDANSYAYVRNDPLSLVDPMGLAPLGPSSCMAPPSIGRKSGGTSSVLSCTQPTPPYNRKEYDKIPPDTRKEVLPPNQKVECEYCPNDADTIDHRRSNKQDWEEGGHLDDRDTRSARQNDPANLAPACRPCNSSKGAKRPEDWEGRPGAPPKGG